MVRIVDLAEYISRKKHHELLDRMLKDKFWHRPSFYSLLVGAGLMVNGMYYVFDSVTPQIKTARQILEVNRDMKYWEHNDPGSLGNNKSYANLRTRKDSLETAFSEQSEDFNRDCVKAVLSIGGGLILMMGSEYVLRRRERGFNKESGA